MAKKIGELIKEARTSAKLTQEQLAAEVSGVTASDISKAERGEKELSQTALKEIARACGVTQKSLLDAAKASAGKSGSSGKTTAAGKTTSSGKTAASGKTASLTLTATEKKLVELYRAADSDTKKNVMSLLKGEKTGGSELLENLLGTAISSMMKK